MISALVSEEPRQVLMTVAKTKVVKLTRHRIPVVITPMTLDSVEVFSQVMTSQTRRKRQQTQEVEEEMEIDDEDPLLSDRHQLLLQVLMHHRMISKQELFAIHDRLFSGSEDARDSIATITNVITPLKMDIKQVVCDVTGATYFVIIHTTGESFFPRCCIFNKTQLEYLKKILAGIVLSGEGRIGKIQAINSADQSMSKSDANSSIKQFVQEKILLEAHNGSTLCLSPLAVVEFEPFLNTCFSDNLHSCELCMQLVFVGRVCEGSNCGRKFHSHCVSKWLKGKRSQCPKCQENWDYDSGADTD